MAAQATGRARTSAYTPVMALVEGPRTTQTHGLEAGLSAGHMATVTRPLCRAIAELRVAGANREEEKREILASLLHLP